MNFLCGASLVVFSLLVSMARAERIHVAPGGMASGAGATWQTALTLDAALSVAESGDVLWLKSGTYVPVSSTFVLNTPVTMLGGFAGYETAADQRDSHHLPTVLSGEVGGPQAEDNPGPVVTMTVAGQVVLQDLTLTRGYASGDGGGIRFSGGGSLELRSVYVVDNRATGSGGGIAANGGSLTVIGGNFSGNRAESQGGAIAINGADLTISDSVLAANSALGGGEAVQSVAGGVCQILIENSTISDNLDGGIAPGLSFGVGTTATVSGSVFSNLAGTSTGAILALDAGVTIDDTTFENCGATSNRSGIVLCTAGGLVTIRDSRFLGGSLPNGAAVQLRVGADGSLQRVAINGQTGDLAGVRIESGGILGLNDVWVASTRQAVIAEQAGVTISSCVFAQNGSETAAAGGVQISGGSLVMVSSSFGNRGQYKGTDP
jgi:hypothetical protein